MKLKKNFKIFLFPLFKSESSKGGIFVKKVFLLIGILTLITGMVIIASDTVTYPQTSEWGPSVFNWGANVKYGGTVTEGLPGWQVSLNFNPFSPLAAGQNMVYESLFYVNSSNGIVQPLLGTTYSWSDNYLALIVNLRNGVKWSDGVPFSADDVVFTFNLLKQYPALDLNGIWSKTSNLESVEASGTNIVVFKFSKPNVPLFYYIARTLVVPEHIWSSIADPVKFTNLENPVGTGPFLFKNINTSADTETFVKNSNYWMAGRPYVDGFVMQGYLSNTSAFLALLKGDVDFSGVLIMNPQKEFIDKNPVTNKIYWFPLNAKILYFNTQKYPFNNPVFRQAIDLAINKAKIDQLVYSNTLGVANSSGIIPTQLKEWLDPTLTDMASSLNAYDPQKAQELLISIGFTKNSNGNLVGPDGKVLPTYGIVNNAGYTDYTSIIQILTQELKKIGLNVIEKPEMVTYTTDLMNGNFDMAMCWSTGSGPSPYYMYYNEFAPNLIGVSNYSRYTNPLITSALNIYAGTSDPQLQKQTMYAIERIMLEEMPFVSLVNGIATNDVNETKFVGWPTYSNLYATTFVWGPATEIALLNVHLK
jgi:peptide/nickel transport system substrate-binding protein